MRVHQARWAVRSLDEAACCQLPRSMSSRNDLAAAVGGVLVDTTRPTFHCGIDGITHESTSAPRGSVMDRGKKPSPSPDRATR